MSLLATEANVIGVAVAIGVLLGALIVLATIWLMAAVTEKQSRRF